MSMSAHASLTEETLDRIFHALSDSTRRAIVLQLTKGTSTVGKLAEPFDMTLAAVGKHIRLLESVGLVRREIVGREHICTLDAAAMQMADDWLGFYRNYWENSLDSMAEYIEAQKNEK